MITMTVFFAKQSVLECADCKEAKWILAAKSLVCTFVQIWGTSQFKDTEAWKNYDRSLDRMGYPFGRSDENQCLRPSDSSRSSLDWVLTDFTHAHN